jgi:hypothetical protein
VGTAQLIAADDDRPAAGHCGGVFFAIDRTFRRSIGTNRRRPFRKPFRRNSDDAMPDRAGPRMRGSPNFAGRIERACARRYLFALGKIGSPAPRFAAPPGVLDPARSGMTTRVSFFNLEKDRTMIALYDYIQELRAELRGCYFTPQERSAAQAELAKAIAQQAELDRAFDAALQALQSPA